MTSTERLHSELHLTAGAAPFRSILFPDTEAASESEPQSPFFADLNLDQAVEAIVAGRDEYNLTPFFHLPLHDVDTVVYRHQIFADLEDDTVAGAVRTFADEMKRTRSYLTLAQKQHYAPERQRWFFDAAATYRHAVINLRAAFEQFELDSPGMQALREFLTSYTSLPTFQKLATDIDAVLDGLDRVRYTLRIRGNRVTVSGYHDEADATIEVEDTFARFREQAGESHLMTVSDPGSMDHVEARIAQLLARLDPAPFRALEQFCSDHRGFIDDRVARFDREVQFYLAYLDTSGPPQPQRARASATRRSRRRARTPPSRMAFDLALADKLVGDSVPVVSNDFCAGRRGADVRRHRAEPGRQDDLRPHVRPAALPCRARLSGARPRRAGLFLFDAIFTHFEREEDIADSERQARGRSEAGSRDPRRGDCRDSVVILNEIFNSTSLADAIAAWLEGAAGSSSIARLLCVCVTFVDELRALGESVVSMVSTVEADDPANGPSRWCGGRPTGCAYAIAIAAKYGSDLRPAEATATAMKAYLLYPDRDFDAERPLPFNAADLTQDLGVGHAAARDGR